ncbi:hypothetical protein [Effusibacillus consociatus]|uniref:LysM domain-containing protein n=1 Tax=Effusibacillus consociatus TaxID=1117041 RepID=A0ABV9Q5C0_9BACL
MKPYICKYRVTLREIANRYHFESEHLLSLNPHIAAIDVQIDPGTKVNLPSPGIPVRKSAEFPSCPPVPAAYQEHWIPLTPIEKMAQTDYDVLIIGSGAGGGAVLWRLCEQWKNSGKRIGMIEAGDLLLPTHAFNLPTFDVQRLTAYLRRIEDQVGRLWPDYPDARIVRALGGRTLKWFTFAPPFSPCRVRILADSI